MALDLKRGLHFMLRGMVYVDVKGPSAQYIPWTVGTGGYPVDYLRRGIEAVLPQQARKCTRTNLKALLPGMSVQRASHPMS